MRSSRTAALALAASLAAFGWPLASAAIPHADAPVTDQTRDSLLATGTLIRIAMDRTISSAHNKAGDPFTFKVIDDIHVGDRVAIPAGTTGSGKVVKASPAHGGRVDGQLRLSFDPITLKDGTQVIVDITQESLVADQNEHNGMAGSVAEVADMTLPGFFLIDFLRKGDDVTLASGAAFHVAVVQDTFFPPAPGN